MERGYFRAYLDADARAERRDSNVFPFVAATEGIKRDGLNLVMAGGRLDNYKRAGGPFLWVHDYRRPPIGRADIRIEDSRLLADVEFDLDDEFAASVASKYDRGFMRAVSIGWDVLEQKGRDIVAWELLDISAVPVGADADALLARHLTSLNELLRLDPDDARAGAVLNARNLELLAGARDAIDAVIASAKKPADEPERALDEPDLSFLKDFDARLSAMAGPTQE